MQEQHVFEYAILRLVPQVEREEFVNIGVVLYCSGRRFLQMKAHLDTKRLQIFAPSLDLDEINAHLRAFDAVCQGGKAGGAIGALTMAERFRWLTATRSTVLQTSRAYVGYCKDPANKLNDIHKQMVLV